MASVYYKYPYLRNDRLLKQIDETRTQTTYIRVTLLDWQENEMEYIEGEITGGNLNIDGSSAVRRTGSISFVATNAENNYNDLSFKYSLNKKIKIAFGLDNIIAPEEYPIKDFPIFWFPQGVFFITGCSFSHSSTGVTVDVKFTDKMALLNGVVGGILPASVEFDKMETYDEDAKQVVIETPTMYQNIKEIVNHWGNEQLGKILIGDLPDLVRKVVTFDQSYLNFGKVDMTSKKDPWKQDSYLWIDLTAMSRGDKYVPTYCAQSLADVQAAYRGKIYENDTWKRYSQGSAIGYQYTTFTYPGELTAAAGTALTTVLDKIKEALGNYEYFYDVDGNFRFQEIKNYLNTSQSSEILSQLKEGRNDKTNIGQITDTTYYYLDVATGKKQNFAIDRTKGGKGEIAYDFSNSPLIISYSNNPNYDNIKNDFIVWGERKTADGTKYPIRYHVAIDEKPRLTNTYVYNNIKLPSYIKSVINSDGNDDYRLVASSTQLKDYETKYGSTIYKMTGRKDVYGRFSVDCSLATGASPVGTEDQHILKQYDKDGNLLSITRIYGIILENDETAPQGKAYNKYQICFASEETAERQESPCSLIDDISVINSQDVCILFETQWKPTNKTYYHCDLNFTQNGGGGKASRLPKGFVRNANPVDVYASNILFDLEQNRPNYTFNFSPLWQSYNYSFFITATPLSNEQVAKRKPSSYGVVPSGQIYAPAEDWRTELLAQGYLAEKNGTNPGYYFPELSVEWPKIYDICHNHFYDLYQDHDENNPSMVDVDEESGQYLITAAEPLDYFLDFIDVSSDIGKYSVNNIGRRTQVLVDNSINCIFEPPTPDLIFLSPALNSGWPLAIQVTTDVGESTTFIATMYGIKNTSTTITEEAPLALYVDISAWEGDTEEPQSHPITSQAFPVIVYNESPTAEISGIQINFQIGGIFNWNIYRTTKEVDGQTVPYYDPSQPIGEQFTIWDSIFQYFMANNPIGDKSHPVTYGGVNFTGKDGTGDENAQMQIRYYQVLKRICKALSVCSQNFGQTGLAYMYQKTSALDKQDRVPASPITSALAKNFQEMLKAQEVVANGLVEAYNREDHYTILNSQYTSISTANAPNGADVAMKDLLYQYTNYKETISLTTIPIYHLEPNTLIKVRDYATGMNDTYVINSMSVSFNTGSTMTINATKAMTKI